MLEWTANEPSFFFFFLFLSLFSGSAVLLLHYSWHIWASLLLFVGWLFFLLFFIIELLVDYSFNRQPQNIYTYHFKNGTQNKYKSIMIPSKIKIGPTTKTTFCHVAHSCDYEQWICVLCLTFCEHQNMFVNCLSFFFFLFK